MGCTLCADLPDEVVDQTLDDFLNGDEAKAFKDEFNEFEHNNAAAEQWDDELEADDELSNHRKKSIISGNAFKPPPKALKPESIKQWLLAVSCCYEHYDKKVPQPSSLLYTKHGHHLSLRSSLRQFSGEETVLRSLQWTWGRPAFRHSPGRVPLPVDLRVMRFFTRCLCTMRSCHLVLSCLT